MLADLHHVRDLTGNRLGVHDVACPACGPSRQTRQNQQRKVLRVWWEEESFARFKCTRCGEQGYVREGETGSIERPRPLPSAQRGEPTPADRTKQALVLWNEAAPLGGSPVERYFSSRGITYAGEALRWHPACPFGRERLGCMVALVRNIVTNEPQAIHRTAIDASGRKISELGANGRLTLGPIGGGAIKLTDDADVSSAVAIGEGLETTLSIRNLPNMGAMAIWSLLAANQVAGFPVLPGIGCLWIAVDNDKSGTGQKASRAAARRWTDAGCEAFLVKPAMIGRDLNDLGGGHECAA